MKRTKEILEELKIKEWLQKQVKQDLIDNLDPLKSVLVDRVLYDKQEEDLFELWEAWLSVKCEEAIILTKKEAKKK